MPGQDRPGARTNKRGTETMTINPLLLQPIVALALSRRRRNLGAGEGPLRGRELFCQTFLRVV